MRILFVNTIQMFAGGEIWMLRTLTTLRQRGHDVHLLCRPETELARRARERALSVHTMPIRGDFGPITVFRTWQLLKKLGIEIVLTNMDKELRFAGIAAKLAGGIVVIPRRGIDYPLKNRLHYRWSYNILADCLVANSKATKQSLLRNAPWLASNRVHVIHNGLDPQPYLTPAQSDLRKELGLQPRDLLLGFVGQLDERKGLAWLLPAFVQTQRQLAHAHLILVGEGAMRNEIKDFAQANGLQHHIHLLGFRRDIDEIMKNLTLLVLPSLWEGFGIVLLEAMAAGKPVVTTNVSSMPEIVQDRITGRVVAVKNENALADAFIEILNDKALAARWGQEGRQRVLQHFTIDHMVDQYETLFQQQRDALLTR